MTAGSTALRVALGLSYRLGGPRVWDLVRGGRCKVLMYHGVTRRDRYQGITNHYGYNLPQALFAQHMRYLARRCHVVSLRDLQAGSNLSRSRTNLVITFDDGYENNCLQAFPVLQELGLPAVFALPTAFVVDGEPLWNDVIEHIVDRAAERRVTVAGTDGAQEFDLAQPGQRLRLYAFLLRECVRGDMRHRAAVTEAAIAELGVPAAAQDVLANEDYRPMSRQQIRDMAASGLAEFASHSVHHFLLAKVDRERQRWELAESRRLVEELSGQPCTAFCVPGGSYDQPMLEQAFGLGYHVVLTSDEGLARPRARVQNRYGIFRHHDVERFADLVHGPVQAMVGRARGVRRRARAMFGRGMAP